MRLVIAPAWSEDARQRHARQSRRTADVTNKREFPRNAIANNPASRFEHRSVANIESGSTWAWKKLRANGHIQTNDASTIELNVSPIRQGGNLDLQVECQSLKASVNTERRGEQPSKTRSPSHHGLDGPWHTKILYAHHRHQNRHDTNQSENGKSWQDASGVSCGPI